MASKLPFLIGLTGGYVLGTRVDSTKAKVSDAVKRQGEKVTDKVVDSVKERLFGGSGQSNSTPVTVPEAQVRPLN